MPPAFTFALTFIVFSFELLNYALMGSSRTELAQSPRMMPPAFTFALTFMTISFVVLLLQGAAFTP